MRCEPTSSSAEGLGGVAAALAACRRGHRVVLTEETDWLGGQLTSQAVPPDEHPWIEQFGCTATYRRAARGHPRLLPALYPLTERRRRLARAEPGRPDASAGCATSRASRSRCSRPCSRPYRRGRAADRAAAPPAGGRRDDGDRVTAVTARAPRTGERTRARRAVLPRRDRDRRAARRWPAPSTSPASRAPDEHRRAARAPDRPAAGTCRASPCCFALSHHEGEDHTIDRPEAYDFWRAYRPDFWPGPLLGFLAPDPSTLEPYERGFEPEPGGRSGRPSRRPGRDHGDRELWMFRRILARGLFTPGAVDSDITLVNWPMNDYWLGARHRRGRAHRAAAACGRHGSSACRCSTGCRPRRPGLTAAPASPGCGCAAT